MAKKQELPPEMIEEAPIQNEELAATTEVIEEAPKSKRMLMAERMKAYNPDLADDDEEGLFGAIDKDLTDKETQLSKLVANEGKVKEMILSDPDMAGFFNSVASGMPAKLAARLHWGETIVEEGDDEEIKARYEEASKVRQEQIAKSKEIEAEQSKNMEASIVTINEFIAKKKMTDQEGSEYFEKVIDMVDDIYMCKYTPDLLERAYKAFNYDTDVKDAIDMGMTEGKNEKIRATTKKVVGDGLPIPQPIAVRQGQKADPFQSERPSFFDPKFKGTQM